MTDSGEAGQKNEVGRPSSDREDDLPPSTDFRLRVDSDGHEAWLYIEGELDMYTSPELMRAIQDALAERPHRVLVAMSLVSFIDSSAIAVLVRAQKEASEEGVQLAIHAPSRNVRRTLDLVGLTGHLHIDD